MDRVEVRAPTPVQMQWMRNIATSFKRTYPELDDDDLYQSLCLYWYEKWDVLAAWATDTDIEQNKAYILRCLTNAATSFCKNEYRQLKAMRPRTDDAYYYSRQKIMDMLPFVESPETWTTLMVKDLEPGGKQDPALGNNALAHYADLTTGWAQLHPNERRLLRMRYVQQFESEEIAVVLSRDGTEEMTGAAVRKRIERTISKLQRIMGGERRARTPVDRMERRRVVSNASAQVAARRGYEGD